MRLHQESCEIEICKTRVQASGSDSFVWYEDLLENNNSALSVRVQRTQERLQGVVLCLGAPRARPRERCARPWRRGRRRGGGNGPGQCACNGQARQGPARNYRKLDRVISVHGVPELHRHCSAYICVWAMEIRNTKKKSIWSRLCLRALRVFFVPPYFGRRKTRTPKKNQKNIWSSLCRRGISAFDSQDRPHRLGRTHEGNR